MKLIFRHERVNTSYTVNLEEPMLQIAEEKGRLSFVKELMNVFELRLNDIKFDANAPSDNFIHFYKFYGASFFDVNFGLEVITARLGTPRDAEQARDLFGRLYKLFGEMPIARQSMTIDRQLSKQNEGDVDSFLASISPYTPEKFKEILFSKGVIYNLKNVDHQLFSQITVTKSLIIPNGVFLNIVFDFSPNKYEFEKAFEVAKNQHDFILKELGIEIESEVTNVSS